MFSNDVIHILNTNNMKMGMANKLFADPDFSDVTLACADNQHLPAHRAVLCASSSFLRELLYDSQQLRPLITARIGLGLHQLKIHFIVAGQFLCFPSVRFLRAEVDN